MSCNCGKNQPKPNPGPYGNITQRPPMTVYNTPQPNYAPPQPNYAPPYPNYPRSY